MYTSATAGILWTRSIVFCSGCSPWFIRFQSSRRSTRKSISLTRSQPYLGHAQCSSRGSSTPLGTSGKADCCRFVHVSARIRGVSTVETRFLRSPLSHGHSKVQRRFVDFPPESRLARTIAMVTDGNEFVGAGQRLFREMSCCWAASASNHWARRPRKKRSLGAGDSELISATEAPCRVPRARRPASRRSSRRRAWCL
jgi:hypothetical protein